MARAPGLVGIPARIRWPCNRPQLQDQWPKRRDQLQLPVDLLQPDALNASHTEWNGFSNFEHMCRRDEEIKTIISTCQCKRYGGCPPYGL